MKSGTLSRALSVVSLISQAAAQVGDQYRRWGHTVAVIGDYLYIDGGEVTNPLNGTGANLTGKASVPANDTFSLPLTSSWTNASVQLKKISKDAPDLNIATLWEDGDHFFTWGGQGPYANVPKALNLWRFNTDGKGGGKWAIEEPSNKDVFLQLKRTSAASFAVCGDAAFHFGGIHSRATDESAKGASLSPGLLGFDMESRTWSNKTFTATAGPNRFGTSAYGGAVCLPSFGSKGIFLPIGGAVASATSFKDDGSEYNDLENLNFYDVAAEKWYTQRTTGETPRARGRFCHALAAGPNKTYDIYMYGGEGRENTTYDDIWVLSLPAFSWTRLNLPSPPRMMHSCAMAGKYLISVGGFGKNQIFQEPDPWKQGLGVLDTSKLSWASIYDGIKEYDSPQVIKDWYQNNTVDRIEWSSSQVKSLFLGTPGNGTSPGLPGSSGTPVGAIVGGVVGGIAVVVIVAAVAWALWRRNKRRQSQQQQQQQHGQEGGHQYQQQPLQSQYTASTAVPSSYGGSHGTPHAEKLQPGSTVPSQTPYSELEGTGRPQELAGAVQYGTWYPQAGQMGTPAELGAMSAHSENDIQAQPPQQQGPVPHPPASGTVPTVV